MTKKFLIGVVAAAAMMGCIKRTDIENPALETGTATISGRIFTNTDLTNDSLNNHLNTPTSATYFNTDWENVAGIEVTATIDVKDLDTRDNRSRGKEVVRTTTDADGKWSLTVRTPKTGEIDATVNYQEWLSATVKQSMDSINGGEKGDLSSTKSIQIDDATDSPEVASGQTMIMTDKYFLAK